MTNQHNVTDADMDCGGFFDHIDDFLDVPNDDVPIDLDTFHGIGSSVWPETDRSLLEAFPCSDSVFSGSSDISAELSLPYEDIVQLEWLSSFGEDSFSGGGSGLTADKTQKGSPGKHLSDHRFRTSSPVSVMDSSSSCTAVKTSTMTIALSRCGRARSKRPLPKTVNFRPITVPPPFSGSEACAESRLVIEIPKELNPELKNKTKNKKIKFTPTDVDHDPPSQSIRKCSHCEITKTPQWRAGPMGSKTLCNACGVRYKLGRLFPEYRPSASPTFVPTLHSNSHKKVLEMRNKVGGGRAANGIIGGSAAIERIPKARVAMDCI